MLTPVGIIASANQAATAWDPTMLPNKVLWLDASNPTSLTTAAAVSNWGDISGAGNHYTQGTAANQPAREDNALNGKPVVRFDGVNDMLGCLSYAPSITDWIIAAVVRTDSGQPSSKRGYFFLGNNSHVGVSQQSEGTMWYASVFGGVGWTNFVPAKVDFWDVQLAWRQGGAHGMRSKGVDQGGTTTATPSAATGSSTLGGDAFAAPTACRVAELVVVSGTWTTADRGKLETYLQTKWGL